MNIPLLLRIFNIIYECRLWVLVPLAIAWFAYAVLLLRQKKKMFFLWLLALPLIIMPAVVATTWCGWHYRMELRNRFAQNPQLANAIDINRMPPAIQAEYARHDYHPRFRDVKAMAVWNLLSFPLIFLAGGIVAASRRRTTTAAISNDVSPSREGVDASKIITY